MATPPKIDGLVDWRPLARGGFATVWTAKQTSLNRLVAVKVDRRTLESDTEQRRFLRESGAAGRMSGHQGIVTVYDAGILTDDRPYLVMALCEGGSLTKWVRGEGRPSQARIREVGVRIADALAATHAQGVLHRDVKPANILIDAYGHAGLADFGLAALPDPGMELSETLEAITPAYAPPEVFHRRPPTEKGDVFSLGATLYAVLSGRPPRWPESGTPTLVDMFERLDEPIERIPGVHDGFMDALLAAMASDPADRPTAAEFRDRLQALPLGPAPDGPDEAGKDDPPPALLSRKGSGVGSAAGADGSRRRRAWIVVAALALVLAVGLAAGLVNLLPSRTVADPQATPTTGTSPTAAAPSSIGATSAGPTSASPTPTPSEEPVAVPAGFQDCSGELNEGNFCPKEPECWSGVYTNSDALIIVDPLDCDELHQHQTFAAGQLDEPARRQSTLEKLPQVKELCKQSVLDSMYVNAADRKKRVIEVLPPQPEDEGSIFRCVFFTGEVYAPIELQAP